MMRRAMAALVTSTALFAGCGGRTSPITLPADSGIDGVVIVAGACLAGTACPDQPARASITVWSGSREVRQVESSGTGQFRILLPPGTYRVDAAPVGTPRERAAEQVVRVTEGRLAPVRLRLYGQAP